ncbi:MAG: M48 family metallopeptidase [Phycisphaerales bacterium]
MIDPIVILLVGAVLVWDGVFAGRTGAAPGGASLALGMTVPFAIALVAHARVAMLVRAVDRDGRARRLLRAERTVSAARVAIGASAAWAIVGEAWLVMVRDRIGDLVLLDEALAILPALLALAWLWAAHYPVERRIRDALVLRSLDTDAGMHAPPTRWQYVLDQARHRALLALVPIGLIGAWVEGVDRALAMAQARGWITLDGDGWMLGAGTLEAAGALLTLALTPPLVRRIWDTVPLGAGALRDRLDALCKRQRVGVAEILVWRTRGATLNAAVMGVFAPVRYVLLSDALLERLPDDELEAVVAHEVGHARRRHLPWLMGALGATIGLGALTGDLAAQLLPAHAAEWGVWLDSIAIALGLCAGFWALGMVSRRFERQADAFAVQHLSGMAGGHASDAPATEEATRAMAGALGRVAALSHIPTERFTWRHGSIGSRQRAILHLAGRPLDAFDADRAANRAKRATLVALVAFVALASWRISVDARGGAQETGRPDGSDRPVQSILPAR